MPADLTIDGDVHWPFITFSNSHDGSAACRVDLTCVRAECRNSIRIGRANAGGSLSMRHTRNVNARLRSAGDVLGLVDGFTREFRKEVEALMARTVTGTEFDALMQDLVGVPEGVTDRIRNNASLREQMVREFYESPADGGNYKGTAWGVVNAVNSFELWAAPVRGSSSQRQARTLTRLTSGGSLPLTARAAGRLAPR